MDSNLLKAATLTLTLALSACATTPAPAPISLPATAPPAPTSIATDGQADALILALSGGGARAAAFSLGALQQLAETRDAEGAPLTAHVALITSVSGGSITAAYYGAHGDAGLTTFRAAYLDKDWDSLLNNPYSPFNWRRAYSGGLNGADRLGDWLDTEVFAHASMADLTARPQIWLNATDLYHGAPFAFTPFYFAAACSDLSRVRMADAVAASMAVPVYFQPLMLQTHPEACAPAPGWVQSTITDRNAPALARITARAFADYRDPSRFQYIHLVDGGVVDNLGLSTITLQRQLAETPYAPLSARDAARLRRLTVLVVNAETTRDTDFPMHPDIPDATRMADAVYDVTIESASRASYDAFRTTLAAWRAALVQWRCALPAEEARALTEGLAHWRCDDLAMSADMIWFYDFDAERRDRLGHIPTRVSLPAADVDAAISGGRDAVAQNAAVAAFAAP